MGPLPEDQGFNSLVTFTNRLGANIRIAPLRTDITAKKFVHIFFDTWYCKNGLPLNVVSDRDHLFTSKFWDALHKITGVKLKISMAFHPQTNGSSERTNKTIVQALRYHIDRNQRGWVRVLPCVRFDLMNTMNTSTGFSRSNCAWAAALELFLHSFLPPPPTRNRPHLKNFAHTATFPSIRTQLFRSARKTSSWQKSHKPSSTIRTFHQNIVSRRATSSC